MRVTICGSIAFYDQMIQAKQQLESLGHEVKLPINEVKDNNGQSMQVKEYYQKRKTEKDENSWVWDRKQDAMRIHFEKVEWSDAVLVLNYDKNGISNYIGGNTLLEMGLAFHMKKKIFLLKGIPEISYREEILAMKPMVVNGNFKAIENMKSSAEGSVSGKTL